MTAHRQAAGEMQTGMLDEVKQKYDLQEAEYRLPIHWLLRRAGLIEYLEKTKLIAEMIRKAPLAGGRVLSEGCGDGRGDYELSRLLGPSFEFEGVDFSRRAIAFARLMAPDINFNVQDSKALDYKDATFDLVIAREVIEHVPPEEVKQFLDEICRVLKPGGNVLLTTPSERRRVPSKHFQHFTPEKLTAALNASGFTVKSIRGFGWFPSPRYEKLYRRIVSLPALWRIRARLAAHEMPLDKADDLLVLGGKPAH